MWSLPMEITNSVLFCMWHMEIYANMKFSYRNLLFYDNSHQCEVFLCKDFLPKFSPMDNFIMEILTRVKFSWKSSAMSDITMEIFTNMMVSVEVFLWICLRTWIFPMKSLPIWNFSMEILRRMWSFPIDNFISVNFPCWNRHQYEIFPWKFSSMWVFYGNLRQFEVAMCKSLLMWSFAIENINNKQFSSVFRFPLNVF